MSKIKSIGWRSRVLLVLAVGGAVFGIAAVVQAAVPSSDGIIHGCYGNASQPAGVRGDLRVRINWPAEPCPNGFTPVDWNQTGPTGPTGATGPTGPTGPTGASSNYFLAYGPAATVAAGNAGTATVTCPAGMVAVAGGDGINPGGAFANVQVNDLAANAFLQTGSITPSAQWAVEFTNESAGTQTVRAWALCVPSGFVTSGNQPAAPAGAGPASGRSH